MSDQPFYAPNRTTAPRRQPQPGEPLFEFLCGHDRFLCELRDHGQYGVERSFGEHEEFRYSRRFDTRALAVLWGRGTLGSPDNSQRFSVDGVIAGN